MKTGDQTGFGPAKNIPTGCNLLPCGDCCLFQTKRLVHKGSVPGAGLVESTRNSTYDQENNT